MSAYERHSLEPSPAKKIFYYETEKRTKINGED